MKNGKKIRTARVAEQDVSSRSCVISEDNLSQLNWLVDYELRAARRYRRFVTLLLIAAHPGEYLPLDKLLTTLKRDSDRIFELEGECAILMPETDTAGGLAMVNRIKSFIKDDIDLRFSVSSFPIDGVNHADLIETSWRRLEKARLAQSGSIVSSG